MFKNNILKRFFNIRIADDIPLEFQKAVDLLIYYVCFQLKKSSNSICIAKIICIYIHTFLIFCTVPVTKKKLKWLADRKWYHWRLNKYNVFSDAAITIEKYLILNFFIIFGNLE